MYRCSVQSLQKLSNVCKNLAHLQSNLRYFLLICSCLDDFERLLAQLIADKLKTRLPDGTLNYMLSLEMNDWFRPGTIAELADPCVSNHREKDRTRSNMDVVQVPGSMDVRSSRSDKRQGCQVNGVNGGYTEML